MYAGYMQFRDEIASGIDGRKYPIEWVDDQILNGAIKVLSCHDALILYEFKIYPTGWLELQGMAAAGKLESIRDMLIPRAEKIARDMGCKTTQISSRFGWLKVLPDYVKNSVTIEKVL
jgi:hypothetical protein